jgi:hypothetical protein
MEPHWRATEPVETAAILGGLTIPWWIAGGWALDLSLGFQTGAHGDADVAILRADASLLARHLAAWEIVVAHRGSLEAWHGGAVPDEAHALWARPTPDGPWVLDVKLETTAGDDWVYRRDPRIRRALAGIGTVVSGIPVLRPEICLLYAWGSDSARHRHARAEGLKLLDAEARAWLEEAVALS